MADPKPSVNITRAMTKFKLIKQAINSAAPPIIAEQAQFFFGEVMENLSGPQINPKVRGKDDPRIGKMPVPRRTGIGASGLTLSNLSHLAWVIWMNLKVAPWMRWVHDGTKDGRLKPRRYMEDPRVRFDPVIRVRIRTALKSIIRSIGRH